jgi:hypothetical protein
VPPDGRSQDEGWVSAEEGDARSDDELRLSEPCAIDDSAEHELDQEASALPPSGEVPAEPSAPAAAGMQLPELTSRCEAIVAHPDGGPRRSGIAPIDCVIDHALSQRVVAAVEATFKAHGAGERGPTPLHPGGPSWGPSSSASSAR